MSKTTTAVKRNLLLPTKKNPLCVVGVTAWGHCLMGGVFKMADTHGFPLAASMDAAARQHNFVPFPCFVADAIAAGWPADRAVGKVREAFSDTGRSGEFREIEGKLHKIAADHSKWTTKAQIAEHQRALTILKADVG